jgi:protein required for attachment to host cells
MAITWIVAADASRARILQVADPQRLVEIEAFVNPDARLQDRDVDTDARTRFPGGHTADPEIGAVEHRNELFAKRVADYLDKARNDHRYERLVIVAAPKMLGQLRQELDKEVRKLVLDEVPKDLSWFNARDLQHSLSDFAKGSGRAP